MTIDNAIRETLKTCFGKMSSMETQQAFNNTQLARNHIQSFCVNLTLMFFQLSKNVLDIERIYDVDLAVTLYGYITPFIAMITLILNLVIIAILTRKELRSPTNTILIGIAIFDLLTILCPLPWFIKMYTLQSHVEYPSLPWCHVYIILSSFLPTVFHNSAMWLTVMLAIHRYIGISKPNLARKLCSYKPVLGGIFMIFVLITVLHGTNLIMENLKPVRIVGKELLTSSDIAWVDTCKLEPSSHVSAIYGRYTKIYWWCRITLGQILPCLILTIFNFSLLKKTCQSYKYRSLLVRGNHPAERSHLKEAVRTSAMLITICACTLIVEIPITILFMLYLLQSSHGLIISNTHILKICHTIPNFMMFLIFPVNFFIYLTLSSSFRKRLCSTFTLAKQKTRDSMISMSVLSSRV